MKLDQDKLRKKRRRWRFVRTLGLVSVAVLLFCGLSFLSFAEFMQVSEIEISGTRLEDSNFIKGVTTSKIAKNVFWFFSGRNIFIMDRNFVKDSLMNVFFAVEDIDIDLRGLKKIDLNITEREVVAKWCGAKCFLLDENGFAFFEARESDKELITFEGGEGDINPGFNFVDEESFKKYLFFIFELRRAGLLPGIVRLSSDRDMQIYFGGDSYMIVDRNDDLALVAQRVKNIMENSDVGFGTRDFLANTEYVDMRYGNKIIYKPKVSVTEQE